MAKLVWLILMKLLVVPLRRRIRGRRHPRWGLRFEVVMEVARDMLQRSAPALLSGSAPKEPLQVKLSAMVKKGVAHRIAKHVGLPAEHFTPRYWGHGGPIMLYFCGGAYVTGTPATHRDMVGRLALASGARVISVGHSRGPSDCHPTAIEDALRAYKQLIREQIDPRHVVLGGDSCGGGVVLGLLQRLRAGEGPMPAAALLISPWCDLAMKGPSVRKNAKYDYLPPKELAMAARTYLNQHSPTDPLVSPVYADLSEFPPLCLLTGELELMHSEHLTLAENAQRDGVLLQVVLGRGLTHDWPLFATYLGNCRFGITEAGDFISRQV